MLRYPFSEVKRMRTYAISIIVVILVMFCGAFELQAKDLRNFENTSTNGSKPVRNGNEVHFRIFDRKCSTKKYESKNENNCSNGNVTSQIQLGEHARVGQEFYYSLEVKIDPTLNYRGWQNSWAKGFTSGSHDSRLRILQFNMGRQSNNSVFDIDLDSKRGTVVRNKICFKPSDFGKWNKIEMIIRWAPDKTGKIKIYCNGREVYSLVGKSSVTNTHCYITNGCDPRAVLKIGKLNLLIGLRMAGFGPEWKKYNKPSQFTPIQKEGIGMVVRDIRVKKLRK